ncbi:MAG: universal stress protein [Desulfovibrionales bacterium]
MKKILWPTDLSENSLAIRDYVSELAQKYDAKIILLYIGLDLRSNFPAYGNYPNPELYSEFESWEAKEAEKRLKTLCSEQMKGCPGMDVRVELGDPAGKILEVAEKEDVSMIIMATHGRNKAAADANVFGSISQQVIKEAKVPIYVINPKTCKYKA